MNKLIIVQLIFKITKITYNKLQIIIYSNHLSSANFINRRQFILDDW